MSLLLRQQNQTAQTPTVSREKTEKPMASPITPNLAGGDDLSKVSPLAPIAFPSSLYSTNHHGLVVVASSVVVVVAGVVVVVVVVVGVVVVVRMVVNWSWHRNLKVLEQP